MKKRTIWWKNFRIGGFPWDKEIACELIRRNGMEIGHEARKSLNNPICQFEQAEVFLDLVKVSGRELTGRRDLITLEEIYRGVVNLGFEECPFELPVRIRHIYKDQPSGEELFIGTPSIGCLRARRIFVVKHDARDGRLWLSTHCYDRNQGSTFSGASQWIFVYSRRLIVEKK